MKLLKYWLISSCLLLNLSCIEDKKNEFNSDENRIIKSDKKKDSVYIVEPTLPVDSVSSKEKLFKDMISDSLKNKQKTVHHKINNTDILDTRDITDPVPINVKQNDSLKK